MTRLQVAENSLMIFLGILISAYSTRVSRQADKQTGTSKADSNTCGQ